MAQEALIYNIRIKPVVTKWRITYGYDGETGSLLMPSLKQAIKWCTDRNYPYTVVKPETAH